MTSWVVGFFLAGLVIWLFYKWIQSKVLRKVERESHERAADDIRAVIEIQRDVKKLSKNDAADKLDAMQRLRKSKRNSTSRKHSS